MMSGLFPNTGPSRRRFLAITAAAAGVALVPGSGRASVPLHRWRGIALGARADIRLYHPDAVAANRLFAAAAAEIARLEAAFSLYRTDSALARLNRDGALIAPPLELVELLGVCGRVYRATEGAFDPSIQVLWRLFAEAATTQPDDDRTWPDDRSIEAKLHTTGFRHVRIQPDRVSFDRVGMALTLNGIAQGFVTDRVSTLLRAAGMTDVMVDLGEIRASGSRDSGDGWPVSLDPDHTAGKTAERIRLRDQAVASSASLGTTFDRAGRIGHILDPRTGRPARSGLAGASVVAPNAAIADALSTAALVCGRDLFAVALEAFPGTSARLVTDAGTFEWLGG